MKDSIALLRLQPPASDKRQRKPNQVPERLVWRSEDDPFQFSDLQRAWTGLGEKACALPIKRSRCWGGVNSMSSNECLKSGECGALLLYPRLGRRRFGLNLAEDPN